MLNVFRLSVILLLALAFGQVAHAQPAEGTKPAPAKLPPIKEHTFEVRQHKGRPMVFIDGKPRALPAYSPVGGRADIFHEASARFFQHDMGAFFINGPRGERGEHDGWISDPFWVGDTIEPRYQRKLASPSFEEQVEHILTGEPDAFLIVRYNGVHEPGSWRHLHEDQLFLTEDGKRLEGPSMASNLYWQDAARATAAVIEYCEGQPWAGRIIGYWPGLRYEGTHHSLMHGYMFDHSEPMQQAWKSFLHRKYGSTARLREAYGDPTLTFETVTVPSDPLRRTVPEVETMLFVQPSSVNRPLRDYLELQAQLFHKGFKQVAAAAQEATGGKRILLWDALKQNMLGWHNHGFFDPDRAWPMAYHDMMAGSGHIGVAPLIGQKGIHGLITPHTYQARGVGGVYTTEGMADTTILRGGVFFSEMDTRSYTGAKWTKYYRARNDQEFAAVTWRNLAETWAHGYYSYWMDVYTDWFGTQSMHDIIGRQVEVMHESVDWEHETVPGIAMILDDSAVLETNGNGQYFNEAIMWEQKTGIARCGVPYRTYMFEDLSLEQFPEHRVFYFPNLFRITPERMKVLEEKVFRDGNVVLWGPLSGVSDGETISAKSASELTGFEFDYLPVNYPHRVQIHNFDHPITRTMDEGQILGSPTAYGPLLFPKGGDILGMAWTKQGRNYQGLAVKTFGQGPRQEDDAERGPGDWASVFTHAMPIPADMWRGLARFAGAHIYTESNDVLMASSTVVGLHSVKSGEKVIQLPQPSRVFNVKTGEKISDNATEIRFDLNAPDTHVYRLEPLK